MAQGRGAAEITLISPFLTLGQLQTLETDFANYQLQSTLTTITVAASSTTTGSPAITTTTTNGFASVFPGSVVTGAGVPVGAKVLSKTSSTAITLDQNATATATGVSLTFSPLAVSVIKAVDQLEASTLNINEMYENNMSQASMAPANKTKVGLEASLEISIGDDRLSLFGLASNAKAFQGTGIDAGGEPELLTIGDDSGLTTGTSTLPYRTAVIRPYVAGVASTNARDWYIYPWAGVEGKLSQSFSLQTQRSYSVTITAYDPFQLNYKVLRGKTSLLV